METEIIRPYKNGHSGDQHTLLMLGGIAMIVVGTGLIMSNPSVRRYMSQMGVGDLVHNVMPDIERYLRLRSM